MKPPCAAILNRLSEEDQEAINAKLETYGALVGGDMGVRAKSAERAVRDHIAQVEAVRKSFLDQLERPDLALKGETDAEIRAREAREAKDAEAKKRAEKAPSEKGFTLTGSDRPVDVAEAHGQKPLFSRAGDEEEKGAVDLEGVAKRLGIDARVVATEDELPAHLRGQIERESAEGDVRGVFDPKTGQVWLVGANIKSEGEAVFVALHESAHRGLRALFGEDLNPILEHIYQTNEAVQARADALAKQHGYDPLRATEETLADMALRGQARNLKGWDRFVEFVRRWVAKMGFPLKVSDEMAEHIAGAAALAGKTEPHIFGGEESALFHRAYHGSPHDFERFDASKIGSGEGHQAYGHGLYFAGKKEVAEHYKNALGQVEFSKDGKTLAAGADLAEAYFKPGRVERGYGGMDRVLDFKRDGYNWAVKVEEVTSDGKGGWETHSSYGRPRWHSTFPDSKELQRVLKEDGYQMRRGRLYEVELAPKEHEYLDWDKPLRDQSASVVEALDRAGLLGDRVKQLLEAKDELATRDTGYPSELMEKGSDVYKRAASAAGEARGYPRAEGASRMLADAGIPGIKYLDGSSRGAGEGHHNYVIFDDKHVEVKAKFSRASSAVSPAGAPNLMGLGAKLREGLSDDTKQREIARGGLRAAMGELNRRMSTTDAALDQARKLVDAIPTKARWEAMQEYQTGGVAAVSNQKLQPIFAAWKANVDERAQKIQSWDEGYLKEVLPHYFSQMWKDPAKAIEWYQRMMGKGPLEGAKSFLKKRAYATYKEGMSWKVFSDQGGVRYFSSERDARAIAGPNDVVKPPLEPISQNFTDIAQLSLQQMDKFIAMHEYRQWLKEEKGWVKRVRRGEDTPSGYARVDDPAFRTQAVFPIMDKETGKPGAAAITYDYMVPELIAKDLNNYLSSGLYQFGLWRNFRYAQNLLLSARLGFSAFHAGFTTVDTLVSHTDIGAQYLLQGDVGKALATWGKAVTSPISAPLEGRKLLKQFFGEAAADADTAALLNFLTQGGARGRMNPTDFNNSWATLKRAWADGKIKDTAFHALPAVMEGVMRPIMHYLVPWQKMTARVLLAKFELDRIAKDLGARPGEYEKITKAMGQDALRQIAYKVVQQVDDRLGQVAYDNLFWNKIAKDVAQASIQSVGWNVGTANVILGGAKDVARLIKPEELLGPLDKAGFSQRKTLARTTGRLSYLISLNLTVGMIGAALQYALSGQSPQDLRDYFFPRTGRKNPDGSDERISMPSYIKDEYALSQHPVTTVQHKLHPFFSMVAELLKNEDFYGNQIVNPDDPWTKMAKQAISYLGKSVEPYAVQNLQQNRSKGTSVAMQLAPFIGITPAPSSVSRTPFEAYVAERYAAAYHETLSPESAEKAQARRDAINALKNGQKPDLSPFTPRERMSIFTAAHTPVQQQRFNRLSLPAKLTAWDRATPEERAKFRLRQSIGRDLVLHGATLDPDVRSKAMDIMRGQ